MTIRCVCTHSDTTAAWNGCRCERGILYGGPRGVKVYGFFSYNRTGPGRKEGQTGRARKPEFREVRPPMPQIRTVDEEKSQSRARLAICWLSLLAYPAAGYFRGLYGTEVFARGMTTIVAYMVFSIAWYEFVRRNPYRWPRRRYVSMVADLGIMTVFLHLGGQVRGVLLPHLPVGHHRQRHPLRRPVPEGGPSSPGTSASAPCCCSTTTGRSTWRSGRACCWACSCCRSSS